MLYQTIFLSISLIITLFFFIYGYNCYYLLRAARRYRYPGWIKREGPRPSVAVHLPIYNEKYVVRRLIVACARMAESYGREKVRIVVLDDSDDETRHTIDELVREYSGKHFKIEVLRRAERLGFKAGALQMALKRADEEYIAIFDADFIPPPDFLTKSVAHFLRDERLGIVQCRWSHINRDYNFITKAVSIGIDAHFLIEQPGRYASNCFLNFNGSGGIIKRKALVEAGGWQSDTLAEDLDASYRIQMKGYRVLYLRELQSPSEVPPTIPSFKKQQGRWACGSLQTAKKLLPALLTDGRIGYKRRLQAFIHLTYYIVHPLMLASFLLALLASILGVDIIGFKVPEGVVQVHTVPRIIEGLVTGVTQNLVWVVLGCAIVVCALAVWTYPLASLRTKGLSLIGNLPSLIVLGLIGYGISLSNTIEASKALLMGRAWAFKRTPKYAVKRGTDDWRSKKYQVPLDFTGVLEAAAATLGVIGVGMAFVNSNFGIALILAFYASAYAFVSWLTLVQSTKGG